MKTGAIVILGSTGQVGRALARVWPDDRAVLWQSRQPKQALTWDILNEPAPDMGAVSGVVQLAGSTLEPALAVTTDLAQAACDLGESLGVPVLIASSQAVYGPATGEVDEASPCAPAGAYGAAKLAMEQAVQGRATCLRIGNVVGCDMLLRNAAQGRVTLDRLPGGGSPERSYISAQHLGAVIGGLIAHPGPLPDVLNVAQPGTVPMHALLEAAGCEWDWKDAGAGVLPRLALDVSRLVALVPLPVARPAALVTQARAAGWAAA